MKLKEICSWIYNRFSLFLSDFQPRIETDNSVQCKDTQYRISEDFLNQRRNSFSLHNLGMHSSQVYVVTTVGHLITVKQISTIERTEITARDLWCLPGMWWARKWPLHIQKKTESKRQVHGMCNPRGGRLRAQEHSSPEIQGHFEQHSETLWPRALVTGKWITKEVARAMKVTCILLGTHEKRLHAYTFDKPNKWWS